MEEAETVSVVRIKNHDSDASETTVFEENAENVSEFNEFEKANTERRTVFHYGSYEDSVI